MDLDTASLVRLAYRPPLDWTSLLRFLKPRAIPGVEAVEGDYYRRTIEVNGSAGVIELWPAAGQSHLLMRVKLAGCESLPWVVERARRIFDLDADPVRITNHLRRSPWLARMVDALPGLRVPGTWDGFELAVRAVLGQQVTVRGATTLAGRLVRAFGKPVETGIAGLSHLFPRPQALVEADPSRIGMPQARGATVRALASAVCRGDLVLEASLGLEDATSRLCAIPGIGPWTANYIAMRGLGERDVFPSTDLGLRRALANGASLMPASELERIAEAWRPWRAYAVMYLWTAGWQESKEAQ